MNEHVVEIIGGMFVGAGIGLILWFVVFRPQYAEIKAYWKRICFRVSHPLTRSIQYKNDQDILLNFSMTDWVELRGVRRTSGQNGPDWGLGDKPPDWWIGSSGRDNNSMLH